MSTIDPFGDFEIPAAEVAAGETLVWDLLVRLFHWSLVGLFITEYLSGDHGREDIHFATGYVLLALLVVRFTWGFIGSEHALFSSFIYRPVEVFKYAFSIVTGHPKRYLGHNPAGAVMVFLLLALLMMTVSTGLVIQATIEFEGPLVDTLYTMSDLWVSRIRHLHGLLVNALLVCIAAHLLGVLAASLQHRENLPWSMITGIKKV